MHRKTDRCTIEKSRMSSKYDNRICEALVKYRHNFSPYYPLSLKLVTQPLIYVLTNLILDRTLAAEWARLPITTFQPGDELRTMRVEPVGVISNSCGSQALNPPPLARCKRDVEENQFSHVMPPAWWPLTTGRASCNDHSEYEFCSLLLSQASRPF